MEKLKEFTSIQVRGAREHNLKNIDIDIPKKQLVIITGVSGSGKSSLAIDTIFAEGQRRFVESLSSYARQFLGQLEKPKFETIRGLSPTISIEQKSASKNPRSTVGTITEIYDYLRVLYARLGVQHCHICGKKIGRGDPQLMVQQLMEFPEGTKLFILGPLIENRKGEYKELLQELRQEGFTRFRIDGIVTELQQIPQLSKQKKHNIEVVVDRLIMENSTSFRKRLMDSVETALRFGNGTMIVNIPGRQDLRMSEKRSCCGFAFPELDPPLFSFNSPLGMCNSCNGLGNLLMMDVNKIIPNPDLSPQEGAVLPWKNYFLEGEEIKEGWGGDQLKSMEKQWGIDFSKPWKKMPEKHRDLILYGSKDKTFKVEWRGSNRSGAWTVKWEGLIPAMMRRYEQTQSEDMKDWYAKYLTSKTCPTCKGKKLKPEVLAVKFKNKSIMEISDLTIGQALDFFEELKLEGNEYTIGHDLINEIKTRLRFLVNVGLEYIMLSRGGPTLSGGEAQRIRLASQLGAELTGVLYVLDEPSIGLHQRDNQRLIKTFQSMRDIGNSLLVIEHDQETIESSDWVIDMGPGAGHLGGEVVFSGPPKDLYKSGASLTGRYMSGREKIEIPKERKSPREKLWIEILGASENNLKNIDVRIPLELMTCITGVSGAGKSSLLNQIIYPVLSNHFFNSSLEVGKHKRVNGLSQLDKVICIDQTPIGRTPRSNPATYTKVFDLIRDVFALLPESRERGYEK